MVWPLIGQLGGGLLGAAGSYLGAEAQNRGAQQAANMSEQAKAWTQLLGYDMLSKAAPGMAQGFDQYAKTTAKLPGVARRGERKAMGQLAGAENSAIQQLMRNQQAAIGGVDQAAASRGFYGGSPHGTQSNQVRANTNQSIGDIMSQFAGQKAGVIGQGTQNLMQGLLAKAQGGLGAAQGKYGMMQDKLNFTLQTANQWGVDPHKLLEQMGSQPEYRGMFQPASGGGGGGGGGGGIGKYLDPTGLYKKAGGMLGGLF